MSTTTTIPTDWDINDASTWTLSQTVDARIGTHTSGAAIREYQEITHRALDLGAGDNLRYDNETETYTSTDPAITMREHAEWWCETLTALHGAAVAMAEATEEDIADIAELIAKRELTDDLEQDAAVCRAIIAALAGS